jgi:hypothetical protein
MREIIGNYVNELGRVSAILAAPEAEGRERVALQLATRTDLTIREARLALGAIPSTKPGGRSARSRA